VCYRVKKVEAVEKMINTKVSQHKIFLKTFLLNLKINKNFIDGI